MSQDKMKGGHKAVPRMPHTKTKGDKGYRRDRTDKMNEQLFEELRNGGHFIVLDVDERISVFYFYCFCQFEIYSSLI